MSEAIESPRAGAWTVPAGFALVPIEPTPQMLAAYWDEALEVCMLDHFANATRANGILAKAYAAMLAAAPAAPAPSTGWTGNADADLALILLDRLDDTGEGNADRIEQLEGLVRKLAAATAAAPAVAVRPDLLERLRYALGDSNGHLTESDLVHRGHELHRKAALWDDWEAAQNRVETEMPEGWAFVIQCSPGDWDAYLTDPDGERIPFDHGCESLASQMDSAVEEARAARSENPSPATVSGSRP